MRWLDGITDWMDTLNRRGVSYLIRRERGREAEPPCGTSLVARPSWPS